MRRSDSARLPHRRCATGRCWQTARVRQGRVRQSNAGKIRAASAPSVQRRRARLQTRRSRRGATYHSHAQPRGRQGRALDRINHFPSRRFCRLRHRQSSRQTGCEEEAVVAGIGDPGGPALSMPGYNHNAGRANGDWILYRTVDMRLTLVEKIAAGHADGLAPGTLVRSGDFVSIRPRHVMTHDNTGAVIPKFKQIGVTKIADPAQPVFAIDHDIQNTSPENLAKYAKIQAFATEHGIDFYPAGTGISHQVMVEQGYVVPGAMVVASDSHSNLYGGAAALGTPVVRTDAASIWATGVTW